ARPCRPARRRAAPPSASASRRSPPASRTRHPPRCRILLRRPRALLSIQRTEAEWSRDINQLAGIFPHMSNWLAKGRPGDHKTWIMDELIAGYRHFRRHRYEAEADRYRKLGREGQAPHTLVIACCDSRTEPAVVFDAGPGDMFVIRNIANLVPPFEPGGEYHSTSAAIEFAVSNLKVKRVLIM